LAESNPINSGVFQQFFPDFYGGKQASLNRVRCQRQQT